MTPQHWRDAWQSLGGEPPGEDVRESILAAYDEPHRAYHTREHLAECFELLDLVRDECVRPGEVTLALYFHDAIYDPRARDNEARSSDWLDRVAQGACVPDDARRRLRALIMATCHDAVPDEPDAIALVDVDLGILGASPERFDQYEVQIRREYRHVPGFFFRRARRKILRQFLDRVPLYRTRALFAARERQARINLSRALG
jgi:predicted metal-dependent HD superfamily phosphohydrolase